jgi:hypothetical protein
MKEYVEKYCRSCDRCFAQKPKKETNRAPLGTYISGEPMEKVAVDIFGPLPLKNQGNKYILVISDRACSGRVISLPNSMEFGVLEVKACTDDRYAIITCCR